MEDNESFNEFYDKLNSIVNTCLIMRENVFNSKLVRKFFRSLLERY